MKKLRKDRSKLDSVINFAENVSTLLKQYRDRIAEIDRQESELMSKLSNKDSASSA